MNRLRSIIQHSFFDVIALSVALALFLCVGLGDRPYSAPSESRYVEIGREMNESGDFVTPRLNYVKYFEKPALFYWIQAESTKLLGLDTFTARIPTAAFFLSLCLLTYALGHMLYGRLTGILSALLLATTVYGFTLSRIVLLDVPVSVFLVGTLTAFIYAARHGESRTRTVVLYLMYASAAGAVLTKGLIGMVLPGAIIFLWLAMTGRWALLKRMRIPSGILLFLALTLPWHIMVAERNPEFNHFYFVHEHFERYLTKEHGRYKPMWFFLVVLIAGFLPWISFMPQAVSQGLKGFWKNRTLESTPLFLALWAGFILLFFSISDSKLIPYILPIFPPIAVLVGNYLAAACNNKTLPAFTIGFWLTIVFYLLLALLPQAFLSFDDPMSKVVDALKQGGDEVKILSVSSLVIAAVLFVTYIQASRRAVVVMLFVSAAITLQLGNMVSANYTKDSMQSIAKTIEFTHKPEAEVAMYQVYYQDLPVYLKRRVTVVDWKGELTFGMEHEDTSAWMMDKQAFWQRWMKNDHLMFVVMRDDALAGIKRESTLEQRHLYGFYQDGRNILFINRPPESLR